MRTIEFNAKDIKECKLALVNQNLTSLQSAFLMQYITNLEQALNEIRELVNNCSDNLDDIMCYDIDKYKKLDILEIIDKYTKEDD